MEAGIITFLAFLEALVNFTAFVPVTDVTVYWRLLIVYLFPVFTVLGPVSGLFSGIFIKHIAEFLL